MEPVVLRTARLVLSAPTIDDLDQIIEYCQDDDTIANTPVPVPYGRTDALAYIRVRSAEGWSTGGRLEFLIRPAGDETHVLGSVSLFGVQDCSAEVGYILTRSARGHGYMTEAVAEVIRWAFAPVPEGLGLVRIRWRALAENTRSAAVAQRLGFTLEGRTRSSVLHRARRHDELLAGLLVDDPGSPTTWS
jgi:RimJ/RimL family protein N-acetyltransferase